MSSNFKSFHQDLTHFLKNNVSLTSEDIANRKDLIAFVRNKLKDRGYDMEKHKKFTELNESKDHKEGEEIKEPTARLLNDPDVKFSYGDTVLHAYDTGLDLEVFGSYASRLSTRGSDLDVRVNDLYSYRYIDLERLSRNLTYHSLEWGSEKKDRLRVIEVLKHTRMPIIKM